MLKRYFLLCLLIFCFSFKAFAVCEKPAYLKQIKKAKSLKKNLFVISGLNFKAEKFNSLFDSNAYDNYNIYVLYWKYSSEPTQEWKSEDLKVYWQKQLENSLCFVNQNSEKSNVGLEVLAYSLGALVFELRLHDVGVPSRLTKITYLAPALRVNPLLSPILALSKYLYSGFKIPSLNYSDYSSRWYTFSGEYLALYQLHEKWNNKEQVKRLDVDTVFFVSPSDELVDGKTILDLAPKIRSHYVFQSIKIIGDGLLGRYHLIVDEKSLSVDDYQLLQEALLR